MLTLISLIFKREMSHLGPSFCQRVKCYVTSDVCQAVLRGFQLAGSFFRLQEAMSGSQPLY